MTSKAKGLYSESTTNVHYNFDERVLLVRTSIIGGMIANQVFDYMNRGRGAPDKETMARFAEEAAAVADLWEEAS